MVMMDDLCLFVQSLVVLPPVSWKWDVYWHTYTRCLPQIWIVGSGCGEVVVAVS